MTRRHLAGVAIVGALIGAWISPGRAYADPVPDKPGGVYVQRIDTRPAGPAIAVTLSNGRTDVLRPCVYEDGRRCYWIGSEFGNGRGSDFLVMSGRVFTMDLSWIGDAR